VTFTKKTKKIAVFSIKTALILLIFVFLFYQAYRNEAFGEFLNRPKHWGYLTLAFLANLFALSLTLIRWKILLNANGVPIKILETFRLGFLSFLFNLAPVGIVTGDGIRAYMLFRQFPETKTRSFAAIFMDRAIGLYVLFLVAASAIFATGFYRYQGTPQNMIFAAATVKIMTILIIISTLCAVLILLPDLKKGIGKRLLERCCGKFGKLKSLLLAVNGYRNHLGTLFVAGFLTIFVHIFFSLGIWGIALGFYGYAPTAAEHLVMHPAASVTQIIPLSLGPYEMVLDKMYTLFPIPHHAPYRQGFGLLISLGYRLISLLIGGAGILFYGVTSTKSFSTNH